MNTPTQRRRRRRRSAADWAALVEEFSQTRLSVERFCTDAGISTASLYTWRKKLQTAPERVGFTPVVVNVGHAETAKVRENPAMMGGERCTFEIALRNGRIVRVSGAMVNASALRAVIAVAEEPAPC